MTDREVALYREIADHTAPECGRCRSPYSCCDAIYCEDAIDYAKERYGIDLVRTDHPRLPLLGPNGCTAAPHLRPVCAVHNCDIAAIGHKKGDKKWTERYFHLREAIEEIDVNIWNLR